MDFDDSLKDVEEAEEADYCTTIELIDYKPVYRKHVGKSPEVIATKIMQHCMIYLMSPNCPIISVIDDERYCINDMFEKRITRDDNPVDIVVGAEKFSLISIKNKILRVKMIYPWMILYQRQKTRLKNI